MASLRFDIVTIFPNMVAAMLQDGILARAIERQVLDVAVHDLRDFTTDRHRVVDDTPFGGGPGMVLKPEPFFRALRQIRAAHGDPGAVVLPTPQGRRFTHDEAIYFRDLRHVVVLCGRYEGIDERVREALATDEISIGDYVLSGGELPALVMLDAVARLVPGVVGDEQSVAEDSFSRGLLDFPQYTRPAEIDWDRSANGDGRSAKAVAERERKVLRVPEVLLSGNHAEIRRWRKRAAVTRTLERRPDLLEAAELDDEERQILKELTDGRD
jgi:tRNA (guanine37-N1)-methyltransferase